MIITRTCLKRPIAASVLTLAVLVIGCFAYSRLEVDYLPKIVYPMIKIHIWWRGATPEEIEKNIAEPIERVMSTIDNLDYLESSSIEGMYTLLVNFEYGVNVEDAYQDVTAAMGRVGRQLPPGMEPPVVIKADPSQLPVMEVTVFSDKRDLVWLRDWCENWLQDQINMVPGTAGVEIVGGLRREIRIHVDPVRVRAYDINIDALKNALANENREMFAGRVTVDAKEIIARTMGEFETLDEIRNIVVGKKDKKIVYLKDIAEVLDFHEEPRVLTRFNDKTCVKLNILKQSAANTVRVAADVRERLGAIREFIPEDIQFGVVEDQGVYVSNAVASVQDSLILAAMLVIMVTYCFLGSWRQILVLIVALPLTMIANFIFMWLAGFSLNVFSLGGLVVAMGVVLDNSTVAVENISRLKAAGHRFHTLEGIKQVTSPMVAATLSFLALVFPFLLVPGITTLLFKELIMAIAGIVVISLLVAWTVTPLMMDFLLRGAGGASAPSLADRANDFISARYRSALEWMLKFKYAVIFCFTLFIAFCLTLNVGTEFLPRLDDGRIVVKLKMPAGTSVARVDEILKNVEMELKGDPTIESAFTLSGGKVWGLYTYEIANEGEVDIQLVPKRDRGVSTDGAIALIMEKVKKAMAPGAKMPVMQMKVKGIKQQGEQEVEVKIKGADLKEIFSFAQKVAAKLNQINELSGVNISMDMTKPEYRIHIDRAKAAYLGVPVKAVAERLQSLVHGIVPTRLRDGAEYYDIRIKVPETKIKSKQDIENLLIESNDGKKFFVKEIADVRRSVGPIEIVRESQANMIVVRADTKGVSVGQAAELAENAVSAIEKPPGVFYEMGGQAQMMMDMKKSAFLVLVFAIFFAFVVLAVQFESLKLPCLALLSLLPVLAGMLIGLKIMGLAIGATVAIGALIAISATVNDGVLLLSFAEELRKKQSYSRTKAVSEAAATRLRPRLMTTFSTIAGFIPLALNWGEGGDMLQPMAVAAISGLAVEVIVTLFFMPCAYCVFGRDLNKIKSAGIGLHGLNGHAGDDGAGLPPMPAA